MEAAGSDRKVYDDLGRALWGLMQNEVPPQHGFRPRAKRYRVTGSATFKHQGQDYLLNFLGTNHTHRHPCGRSPDDRENWTIIESEESAIDRFVESIPNGSTIYIEDGGHVASGNFDELLYDVVQERGLDVKETTYFTHKTDLGYASHRSAAQGIQVVNMDLIGNPACIEVVQSRRGADAALDELLWRCEDSINNNLDEARYLELRNAFVTKVVETHAPDLLPQWEKYQQRYGDQKAYPRILEPWLHPQNDLREDFMVASLIDGLANSSSLNFIAHSVHVLSVLKKLSEVGEISDFRLESEWIKGI